MRFLTAISQLLLVCVKLSLACPTMDTITSLQSQHNQCVDINIDVYKPIDNTKNTWDYWLKKVAGATGLLTHSGFKIVSFSITSLIDTLKGDSSSNGHLNKLFEKRVNEAFNQLSTCMKQEIVKGFAVQQRRELYVIADDFEALVTSFKSASEQTIADKFRNVFNEIHKEIQSNFKLHDTIPTPINRFIEYLPVFQATAMLYDTIFRAYLIYLKQQGHKGDFKAYYSEASDDAHILSLWILEATTTIQNSLALNPATSTLTTHGLDSIAYVPKIQYKPYYEIYWGTPKIVSVEGDANPNTYTFDYTFIFTTNSGASTSCKWPNFECSLEWYSCWFCHGGIAVSYLIPTTDCRQRVKNHAQLVLDQYSIILTQFYYDFTKKYYQYTSSINNKLQEIRITEEALLN